MAPQHQPTIRRRQTAKHDGEATVAAAHTPATSDDAVTEACDATVTIRPVEEAPHDSTDVAAAIERERLRTRIRTLERELVASERHRQGLIDQYEWLLAERKSDASNRSGTTARSETVRSRLYRLFLGE